MSGLVTVDGLDEAIAARFDGRAAAVERRASAYQSSFLLDEIDVHLDDGTTACFVAKAAGVGGMSSPARLARPAFLEDADRERVVYESILGHFRVGAPLYYGTFDGPGGVRYLLLERIEGAPLSQFGELDAWHEAARWLARLHATVGSDDAAGSAAGSRLVRYDRRYYEGWLKRARAFCGARLPSVTARAYGRATERLLQQPATFVHGEFYAPNIMVERGDTGFVVRPVDWEMAALAPALMDLACLLAGRWTDETRERVALAYYDAAAGHGAALPSRDDYFLTLDCCLVHLSVRNLGWSRHWSPPPDRDHDWLGDVVRICAKWNL